MKPVEFHIVSAWHIRGSVDEVFGVVNKPQEFTRWWPDVYLRVEEIEAGDENGVGRVLGLCTRGILPYTLNWRATAIRVEKPAHLVIDAEGDLRGRGEWLFRQRGPYVRVDYDWRVVAGKAWMRLLAPLLKPVFAANHRWAMRKGEQGLQQEVTRLRNNRARVMPPATPSSRM
jgi:hypothetical protein